MAGSVMLGAGAIGPLVKTLLMEVQLDDISPPRTYALLGLAALSLAVSAVGRTGWLSLTAIGAIVTLGSMFVSTGEKTRIPIVSDLLDQLTSTLSGLLTDFGKIFAALEWGAFCLVGGILLLLLVGLLRREF
ncbi:MAG: hypothetical protein ACKORB_05675 [Opitutia bacterium]